MYLFNIFFQLLLPLVALAVPTPTESQPSNQEIIHTRNFTIKSHVIAPAQSSFENLYLEPYHIYPAFNYATLWPKSDTTPGIVGFLNGTGRELENDQGNLLFLGGGGVYGFIIDRVNSTYNPVEINAGEGTKGIYINQDIIKYNNPISGGFYACNTTLLYGDAVQLFYRPKTITAPQGCADVQLVVEYV
ncbi:MAG: hypothetical protein L6R38_007583 [Xanthoria sp. 2 TBL-2021]|nr:MAG: hypothetical protein L6R38_007583 [Xanthoria sp. 2 TBL-2021]